MHGMALAIDMESGRKRSPIGAASRMLPSAAGVREECCMCRMSFDVGTEAELIGRLRSRLTISAMLSLASFSVGEWQIDLASRLNKTGTSSRPHRTVRIAATARPGRNLE